MKKDKNDKTEFAELKQQNEQLISQLYEVNQRLKDSEAFKSHFISNITNELLNPFSSILAVAENIAKLEDGEMDKARKMAESIHQEAFHLDFQLKNVFAAAMTEAGLDAPIAGSVNIPLLIEKAVHFFDYEAGNKHLNVVVTTEEQSRGKLENFMTDASKISLIIKNIISNAIKFSHPEGEIRIRLETNGPLLRMQIRDFGKGIPEAQYGLIFDRFKQLDLSINSVNTGQGLGLSIVKAYLLALDGKIRLESPPDGGLEVIVELPELSREDDFDDLAGFILNGEENF
jgi:signal transduction histidine kinase